MYKVIVKIQRPNYKWEKTVIGIYNVKCNADVTHENSSRFAHELLGKGEIIDYQIETIETA